MVYVRSADQLDDWQCDYNKKLDGTCDCEARVKDTDAAIKGGECCKLISKSRRSLASAI